MTIMSRNAVTEYYFLAHSASCLLELNQHETTDVPFTNNNKSNKERIPKPTQSIFLTLKITRMSGLFLFSFLLVQQTKLYHKASCLTLLIDELSYCRYGKKEISSEDEVEQH